MEFGVSYCRSQGQGDGGGPGRRFQGCNVRSAPALMHNGSSVSSAEAESAKRRRASPFQENRPATAGPSPPQSRQEQAAPPASPASGEAHFHGDTISVPCSACSGWGVGGGHSLHFCDPENTENIFSLVGILTRARLQDGSSLFSPPSPFFPPLPLSLFLKWKI